MILSSVCAVGSAGESAEPPRPGTWMVIFLGAGAGSGAPPTLSLILGCGGSVTTFLAFSSSCWKNSWRRSVGRPQPGEKKDDCPTSSSLASS